MEYAEYTVAQNGKYTFKIQKSGLEDSYFSVRVKNIEKFKKIEDLNLAYSNTEQKAYNYKGAAVPKGYYVDTKTDVDTGLVITDEVDSNGYSTGNEWVWVPVVEDNNYKFHLVLETPEGMYGAPSVTYTNYSKLWNFTTDISKVTDKTTMQDLSSPQVKPSEKSSYSEPSLVIGTDDVSFDEINYTNVYKRENSTSSSKNNFSSTDGLSGFASQLRDDYDNMVISLNRYKGFYIGRYELTSNGEKSGISLVNKNWYELYNECMFLNKGANTETSMIYGTLWDAMLKWLASKNYNVGEAEDVIRGNGNYKIEEISVYNSNRMVKIIVKKENEIKKLKTGQISYTKCNNIYDLAGNCYDWTQEAGNYNYNRVSRGGNCTSNNEDKTYFVVRISTHPTASYPNFTARPQLIIK